MTDGDTCVVTVTYGNRYSLLERVVTRALEVGAVKVVIVDNASVQPSRERIEELAERHQGKVSLIRNEVNLGSAGGYRVGLEQAAATEHCEYVWLLDDDNLPAEDALEALLDRATTLDPRSALMSLRDDRTYLRDIATGVASELVFPRRSSFRGFHVLDIGKKIKKLLSIRSSGTLRARGPMRLPFAPYGGLFFRRSILSEIGMPDERFFVYCDDNEYTYRINCRGGSISLVPESVIHDIDKSWHVVTGASLRLFLPLFHEGDDYRIYYGGRNAAYFYKYFWADDQQVYALNRTLYLTAYWIVALFTRKLDRFDLLRRAVADGERGKLGRVDIEGAAAQQTGVAKVSYPDSADP